jgi:hypothetical protein
MFVCPRARGGWLRIDADINAAQNCEFQRKAARYSDLIPATVPI